MKTRDGHHDFERAVPFLLARAETRVGTSFGRALKPYGLSLTEWRVCASLHDRPEQTLSELSLHASTDLSALSRIVERLVVRQLADRRRDADDRREIRVALSVKGDSLARDIGPLAQRHEATALAGFSAAEIRQLRDLLIRLHRNAAPIP